MAPLGARELNSRRKRRRTAEEEGDDDKAKMGGEENVCPNGSIEKTSPVRKVKGQAKISQRLFASGAEASTTKGAGKEVFLTVVHFNNIHVFI